MFFYLTLVLCLALSMSFSATAQTVDPTPDFKTMPVGLIATYGSRDESWAETHRFLGRKGDAFVMEIRNGAGEFVRKEMFDSAGHMIQRVFADGRSVRFTPHHCWLKLGPCHHQYEWSTGLTGESYTYLDTSGEGYRYDVMGKDDATALYFRTGAYGLAVHGETAMAAWALIDIKLPKQQP